MKTEKVYVEKSLFKSKKIAYKQGFFLSSLSSILFSVFQGRNKGRLGFTVFFAASTCAVVIFERFF